MTREEIVTKPRNRFGLWFLWALGVRTLSSDSEYGERLANYRKWSTIPVITMSITVFVLIAVKITLAMIAFVNAFNALDPETVIAQHDLNTPVITIVAGTMGTILTAVLHSFPLYLEIPLILLWLLAFVVDFIVAAVLAENKKLWWRRHWGGIVTALFTIP